MPGKPFRIAYLCTTFPQSTETFVQREVAALRAAGAEVEIHSLWRGKEQWAGGPVHRFHRRTLFTTAWRIPWRIITHTALAAEVFDRTFSRPPPAMLNCLENLLGAGFALVKEEHFRTNPPDWVHAAWAGGPGTAAWLLSRLAHLPFSTGAHAYDLYEHGGDWFLEEKLHAAKLVHTSTEMARRSVLARGIDPSDVVCVRRSLPDRPPMKPLRPRRLPLRICCIARLVPKKGLRNQLLIYAAMRQAGLAFEARFAGDGPLRPELERLTEAYGLAGRVTFLGKIPEARVWELLDWADAMLHTGVVSRSGDRDGLPNVIPEAMAAGTVVIATPTSAVTEAVHDGVTGLLAPLENADAWLAAFRRVKTDDALCGRLRENGRRWVEENFNAARNGALLLEAMRAAHDRTRGRP